MTAAKTEGRTIVVVHTEASHKPDVRILRALCVALNTQQSYNNQSSTIRDKVLSYIARVWRADSEKKDDKRRSCHLHRYAISCRGNVESEAA